MERHEGRELRLAPVIELIEACMEMGERLDPDTAIAVLDDIERKLAAEQEKVVAGLSRGSKPPTAQPEDYRDAGALIMAARILMDVSTCMQMRKQPGRLLRLVLKARDQILEDVVKPMLLGMTPENGKTIMEHAGGLHYTLWHDGHREALTRVLESAAKGGCIRKETREGARYFLDMLVPATERDRERSEQVG